MSDKSARLTLLKSATKQAGANSVLVTNFSHNANFFWLTNSKHGNAFYWDLKNKPVVIANPMEAGQCKSWMKVEVGHISDFVNKNVLAVDGSDISIRMKSDFFKQKLADISKSLDDLRAVKSKYEVRCISKACDLTKTVFEFAFSLDKNKTEREIFSFIRQKIALMGLEEAFDPIVATGSNVRVPHHEALNVRNKGTFLIDAGVKHNGYCSDVTRTTGSKFEALLEKSIGDVEDVLTAGVACKELDQTARKSLGKYSKFFITALGHGLGINVHEFPRVSSKSTDILKDGNVITIEPGIYTNGGIRIENVYVVKKKGFKKLTEW